MLMVIKKIIEIHGVQTNNTQIIFWCKTVCFDFQFSNIVAKLTNLLNFDGQLV